MHLIMISDRRLTVRQLLATRYEELKRKLTRRLGSAETAAEVLHETYLRLDGGVVELGRVRNPGGLLYRIALNVAMDGYRADARWLRRAELQALTQVEEDRLTPERIVLARSEIAMLEAALTEMPARRRAIFTAALVEDLPYRTIAARFGVSVRLVEREVRRALDHAGERLEKAGAHGRPSRETSVEKTTGKMSPAKANDE
jgi:RNA polymerase sigma-70 factor, ECF subfamily